jgi:hypothetical protein
MNLSATLRLHPVFHVNNLRPCSTTSLRQAVPNIVREGDDEEFEVCTFLLCALSHYLDVEANI